MIIKSFFINQNLVCNNTCTIWRTFNSSVWSQSLYFDETISPNGWFESKLKFYKLQFPKFNLTPCVACWCPHPKQHWPVDEQVHHWNMLEYPLFAKHAKCSSKMSVNLNRFLYPCKWAIICFPSSGGSNTGPFILCASTQTTEL